MSDVLTISTSGKFAAALFGAYFAGRSILRVLKGG